jgi:hypothetical protein
LAEEDLHVKATERALDEVASERITIEKELERLQEAQQGALSTESVPAATRRLSQLAADRLADPTTELMAEVFDLLQVDLIRVKGRTFEGVARIPLPDPDSGGEVWEGAPQDPLSNLPWSGMRVPFPISVELPMKGVPE